jgi:1-pyrroline-2-carboxylate reductase [NAD(P)H]
MRCGGELTVCASGSEWSMRILTTDQVHAALSWDSVLPALERAYAGAFTMPQRNVMRLSTAEDNHDAFALLPAWTEEVIAVKAFTYFPQNPPPYASLYAQILLFDRAHGHPLAVIDGTSVTFWRTAGISALAAKLLSRQESDTLFLIGTGKLAPYLIRAHASVRPLRRVMLWGRNAAKADALRERMQTELPEIDFTVAASIESACAEADIIVCASGSPEILVQGGWLRPGTHLDCLGNHHAEHRECDTESVLRSRVYVDTFANCLKEAGEILIPIQEGRFTRERILGELADLCAGRVPGRVNDDDITLFKSVGAALGDLATAQLVWQALSD